MAYKKIKDFSMNETASTVLLVEKIEQCMTKNNSPYCKIQFTDGESRITSNLWSSEKKDVKMQEGQLATVTLYLKEYMERKSYEIQNYSDAPADADIRDFIKAAPVEPEKMYDMILDIFRKYRGNNPTCISFIVEKLYDKNREKLLYWSAAKTVHHACHGGLLYHTYRMMMAAQYLGRLYKLDMELLLAGVALHDIGKLQELETTETGSADYTPEGNMFGHAMLGIRMVEKEVFEASINGEKISRNRVDALEHVIAAHHNELEWGAIAKPVIPEASAVHCIDKMDAYMYQYEDVRATLEPGTMSDRIFGLGACVLAKDLTE